MSLPVNTAALLDRFEGALSIMEAKLNPFLSIPSKELVGQLSPDANAKLNLAYSYGLNSLFYMHLRTQGVDPQQHPVKVEMDRVKRYMIRTKEAEEKRKGRKAVVNVAAAGRMMKAALAANDDNATSSEDEDIVDVSPKTPAVKKGTKKVNATSSEKKSGVKRSRQKENDADSDVAVESGASQSAKKKTKQATTPAKQNKSSAKKNRKKNKKNNK